MNLRGWEALWSPPKFQYRPGLLHRIGYALFGGAEQAVLSQFTPAVQEGIRKWFEQYDDRRRIPTEAIIRFDTRDTENYLAITWGGRKRWGRSDCWHGGVTHIRVRQLSDGRYDVANSF